MQQDPEELTGGSLRRVAATTYNGSSTKCTGAFAFVGPRGFAIHSELFQSNTVPNYELNIPEGPITDLWGAICEVTVFLKYADENPDITFYGAFTSDTVKSWGLDLVKVARMVREAWEVYGDLPETIILETDFMYLCYK